MSAPSPSPPNPSPRKGRNVDNALAIIIPGECAAHRLGPVCRAYADKGGFSTDTFAVLKGEVPLGLVTAHPCGEWTFVPSIRCPALRNETVAAISQFIDNAEQTMLGMADGPEWEMEADPQTDPQGRGRR